MRAINWTSECGRTLHRTAKPGETYEPEKGTVILAESYEQEEDTVVLPENGEQEEDTLVLCKNGEQEEDTVILTENGEPEEETELAENWEHCRSGGELCSEQYSRNEEDALDL